MAIVIRATIDELQAVLAPFDRARHVLVVIEDATELEERSYLRREQAAHPFDPFRLHYRMELRDAILSVVRATTGRKTAAIQVAAWASAKIDEVDRSRFIDVVEQELACLHEGNFARYKIAPAEFVAWQMAWNSQ